jgi:hypothetical protein
MTIFGNRVFAYVTKVRIMIGPYWVRVGPDSNDSVLVRSRKHRQAQGRRSWKTHGKTGRDRSHWKL